MIFLFLLKLTYFLIPGAFANMIPVFVKKLNFFNYPLDFRMNFFGERLFGANKTFRGLFFGIGIAIILLFFQQILYNYRFFKNLSLIDYSMVNFLLFGFLTGFGVLVGDLIGSFLKRRLYVAPGKSLLIVDQINGGFGLAIFIVPVYFKSLIFAIWIILAWTIGHFILKYLGYLLKLYKEKI